METRHCEDTLAIRNVREQDGLKRKGLITIYVEPELKEQFVEYCKKERISMSSCLEKLLYDLLNPEKE